MKKRLIFLGVYAVIVTVILVYILFIAPDDFFMNYYDKDVLEELEKMSTDFTDYRIQQEQLKAQKYDYEYQILESLGKQSYIYKCSGTLNEKKDKGSCTSPEFVAYTEADKEKVFKHINNNYLNPTYIFDLIKDIEPEKLEEFSSRMYRYNLKMTSDKLDSEIRVYTNKENITKIEISNAYETYILKYNNVVY